MQSKLSVVAQSCLTLCNPWTVAQQAPLSMGFPRQEYRGRLLFPSPGHLSDPGIEPTSPAWQADTLPLSKTFQMYKLDLEKAEEQEIRLPTSVGS